MLTREAAAEAKATAVVCAPPFYLACNQEELFAYYEVSRAERLEMSKGKRGKRGGAGGAWNPPLAVVDNPAKP